MTLAGFVVKNALRNPRRTVLTILSIAMSLAMIVILRSVLLELINPTGLNELMPRIVVRNRVSLTLSLPLNYQEKIAKVPGVQAVTPLNWFGGEYKTSEDAVNFFPRFAIDPSTFFNVFTDYKPLPPDSVQTLINERTACLVGVRTMKALGIKEGDRIFITGDIYPVDLELTVRGAYDGLDTTWLMFNHKYLDELLGEPARPGTYFVLAQSPEAVPGAIQRIEEMFRNSATEVKAETEKAFQLSFIEMLGNVKLLFSALISVVVFAVTLIAASTMAMAMRERTREIAILKTIGYERLQIMVIMLAEGLVLSAAGGILGVGGAWYLLSRPWLFIVVATGVCVAVGVGVFFELLTALLPEPAHSEQETTTFARANVAITRWGPGVAALLGEYVSVFMSFTMPPMDWMTLSAGFVPVMDVKPETVGFGISIAFIVGVVSSLPPAFAASRRSVMEGIRDLG